MSESALSGELRTVTLDAIDVQEGFNPRECFEHVELERLSRSIKAHGVLQPLVVAPAENGYRLVAGERRYRAAKRAGLEEVPVVVRDTGDASGLDLAVIENVTREDLDPVEEARSYERLMRERNLTRKGLAEHLGVAQKRVTERLQILDLPTELHGKVASGAIPPSAVRSLAGLGQAHEELPAVAVACVEEEPANEWEEPTTWADVVRDPVGVVLGHHGGGGAELPAGVYQGGAPYPADRFDLSEKASGDLEKLCKLIDSEPHELVVRFEREELDHLPTARRRDMDSRLHPPLR